MVILQESRRERYSIRKGNRPLRLDSRTSLAKGQYLAYCCIKIRQNNEGINSQTPFYEQFENALATAKLNLPQQPLSPNDEVEDDEKWMTLEPDDLETLLENRSRNAGVTEGPPGDKDEALAQHYATRFGDFTEKLEGFVEGQGGLDGALFEGWVSSPSSLSTSPTKEL